MLSDLIHYEMLPDNLWHGRKDSLDGERYFQHIKQLDLRQEALPATSSNYAIVGFCSDEGIRRNEGRVGAKEGPNALREQLGKLPCHNHRQFIDLGNIVCPGEELEAAQQQLGKVIEYSHDKGYKTLVFGGGHEVAWGHYLGLKKRYRNLGIINFDAHFDLRAPKQENYGTSGTPFWQIAHDCYELDIAFDYCCLGIQRQANTRSLFTTADMFKASYLTVEQINQESLAWQKSFLDKFISYVDHIYLSICMDVFAENYAPGVSAPQALGLSPWQALSLLKYIMQTGKVVSIDIAELSPKLDSNQKTARLAATLLAEILQVIDIDEILSMPK